MNYSEAKNQSNASFSTVTQERQTRHVHRILYVSTVSWVNLTITILPGPAQKPTYPFALLGHTKCLLLQVCTIYLKVPPQCVSKLLRNKGKLCNTIRESYVRESFCQGVQFSTFLNCTHLNRYLTGLLFTGNYHVLRILVVLCK